MWSCFFFFQAEDGIRDIGVTGVQTCALPILRHLLAHPRLQLGRRRADAFGADLGEPALHLRVLRRRRDLLMQPRKDRLDRKSTRLNSSHANISYAVFCLKKKNKKISTDKKAQ